MKKRIVALVAVPLLVVSILAVSNATAGTPVKFRYNVSNAVIQAGTGLPQTGAQARADNGDVVRVSGGGRFNSESGRAGGSGAFVHTDAEGDLVGFGRWKATGVLDFELFGCGFAADGTELPPNFCGGVLTLSVHLIGTDIAAGTAALDGVMVITCKVGDAPEDVPADAKEGITLDVPNLISFDDTLEGEGGLTIFVSQA